METIKKLLIALALIITTTAPAMAQEIYFSQFYADKLSLNPAYAAISGNSEICMILRDQFPGVKGGFKTYGASYLQNLGRCGFGLRAYGTASGGGYSQHQVSATYANIIKISKKIKCSTAIEASFAAKNLNQNGHVYYSMIDPLNGSITYNQQPVEYTAPRDIAASVGIIVFSKTTSLGIAAYSIAQYKISGGTEIPKTISIFANHKIELSKNSRRSKEDSPCLIPSIIFRHQDDISTIQTGAYIENTPLIGGLSYRMQTGGYTQHYIIASIGTTIRQIQIGYGHDFNLSTINKMSYGSHEIAVKYKLNNNKKNHRRETIFCPAF